MASCSNNMRSIVTKRCTSYRQELLLYTVQGGYEISHTFFQIPKMEPMETRQSMLEEPSRGSKDTTYLPRSAAGTSMHFSFSSDTITPT